jgi:hypothetical protein
MDRAIELSAHHRQKTGPVVRAENQSTHAKERIMAPAIRKPKTAKSARFGVYDIPWSDPTWNSRPASTFAFLADPATHELREPIIRIDTHGAAVFLAGKNVYKVKRAVRFPFMNFSTLHKRRRRLAY